MVLLIECYGDMQLLFEGDSFQSDKIDGKLTISALGVFVDVKLGNFVIDGPVTSAFLPIFNCFFQVDLSLCVLCP